VRIVVTKREFRLSRGEIRCLKKCSVAASWMLDLNRGRNRWMGRGYHRSRKNLKALVENAPEESNRMETGA